jgi:tetratricopeptide (TPR) repeat protein
MMYLLKPNKNVRRLGSLQLMLLFISVMGFGQYDPYLSGRAYMHTGMYDSAQYHLERALEQNPGSSDLYYQLGVAHFTLKNYPDDGMLSMKPKKGVREWVVSTWPKVKSG